MGFSINTNVPSVNSNLRSNSANSGIGKNLSALASDAKLNGASNDISRFGISDKISSHVSDLGQAIMNANESVGMLQVADGALQGYNDNLDRVKTLTLQASNGTMSSDDRVIIQKEIDGLLKSLDDIAKSTNYNGMKLLDGTGGSFGNGTFVTQFGADGGATQSVTIGDTQVSSLVGSIDVTTQAGALSAMDTIESAMGKIGDIRSTLGASQNQLESTIRNIFVTHINLASAESQMRDVDFAAESANFSRQNIMNQIGSFAQSQANAGASNVAGLLQ
ncbi:MAG: flagellin [Campylobacterales bacterium]|nr:flagellin [Campylobacterales bacterium]